MEREQEKEMDTRDRVKEKEELEELRAKILAEGHDNPDAAFQKVGERELQRFLNLCIEKGAYVVAEGDLGYGEDCKILLEQKFLFFNRNKQIFVVFLLANHRLVLKERNSTGRSCLLNLQRRRSLPQPQRLWRPSQRYPKPQNNHLCLACQQSQTQIQTATCLMPHLSPCQIWKTVLRRVVTMKVRYYS